MAKNDNEQPESSDRLGRLERMLADLVAIQMANVDKPAGERDALVASLTGILEKVTGNQAQTAELIEKAKRSEVRASNTIVPMCSPFNPRGELSEMMDGWTKPKLVCEMHCPHRIEDEVSTIEEVELFNLLTKAGNGEYIVQRNDDSKVKLKVVLDISDLGKVERMRWLHDTAFRNEYFRTMPSVAKTLRQMLSQAPPHIAKEAHLILTMDDWALMIEKKEIPVSV